MKLEGLGGFSSPTRNLIFQEVWLKPQCPQMNLILMMKSCLTPRITKTLCKVRWHMTCLCVYSQASPLLLVGKGTSAMVFGNHSYIRDNTVYAATNVLHLQLTRTEFLGSHTDKFEDCKLVTIRIFVYSLHWFSFELCTSDSAGLHELQQAGCKHLHIQKYGVQINSCSVKAAHH